MCKNYESTYFTETLTTGQLGHGVLPATSTESNHDGGVLKPRTRCSVAYRYSHTCTLCACMRASVCESVHWRA